MPVNETASPPDTGTRSDVLMMVPSSLGAPSYFRTSKHMLLRSGLSLGMGCALRVGSTAGSLVAFMGDIPGFGVLPGLAQDRTVGSKVGFTLGFGLDVTIGLIQGRGVEVISWANFTERSNVSAPPGFHIFVFLTRLPSISKEIIFPENFMPAGCSTEREYRPRKTFDEAALRPSMTAVTITPSELVPSIVTVPENLCNESV